MIHPTAVIGEPPQMRDWKFGDVKYEPVFRPHCRVGAFSVVDCGYARPTVIGCRSWVMAQVHVGHDVVIGEDCEIASGTALGGYVEIGDGSKIGINATIRPLIKIGRGVRIGAGAVVTKDVPDGEVWAGNPARKLR